MKAAIVETYGPPEAVKIVDWPKPSPGPGEVLVRVRATSVNSGDARVRALRVPAGLTFPMRLRLGWSGPTQKILGLDLAGDVEAVGPGVTQFKPGDRVLASNGFKFGSHAEYCCVSKGAPIVALPDELPYAEAVALLFGGLTVLNFFSAANVKRGESILINNASGAVGVMAVQLAKHEGLVVTAVCGPQNMELMAELGADHVVNYKAEDFTRAGHRYDLIMDNHGNAPYARVKHLLAPGGRYMLVIGGIWQMISASWNKNIITGRSAEWVFTADNFKVLIDLWKKGILKPVIGHRLAFTDIVEAHRIVDGGHKRGSLVLEV